MPFRDVEIRIVSRQYENGVNEMDASPMESNRSTLVDVQGVEIRHGRKPLLVDVDLSVEEGTCTALLGRNGAGKTSLLMHLMGLAPRRRGQVRVAGVDPQRHPSRIHREVGCVPQGAELPGRTRVDQHGKWLLGVHPNFDAGRYRGLQVRFALPDELRWKEASRGQRAAWLLMSALATRPRLLLLDEPFDGLDPFARRGALDVLVDAMASEGTTLLFSGHSLEEVEALADRVVWVEGTGIGFDRSLEDLKRNTAKVKVTLGKAMGRWSPPGTPQVEPIETGYLLTYLDWGPWMQAQLDEDDRVEGFEVVSRDLSELLIARANPEGSSCAA